MLIKKSKRKISENIKETIHSKNHKTISKLFSLMNPTSKITKFHKSQK
jgi:hypothetical protein